MAEGLNAALGPGALGDVAVGVVFQPNGRGLGGIVPFPGNGGHPPELVVLVGRGPLGGGARRLHHPGPVAAGVVFVSGHDAQLVHRLGALVGPGPVLEALGGAVRVGHPNQVVPLVVFALGPVAGGVDGDLLAVAVAELAHQLAVLRHPGGLAVLVVGGLGDQAAGLLHALDVLALGALVLVAVASGVAGGVGLGDEAVAGILVAPDVAADVGDLGEPAVGVVGPSAHPPRGNGRSAGGGANSGR